MQWVGPAIGAVAIILSAWAGNAYGPNALRLNQIVSVAKIKNAELARMKRKELADAQAEDERFKAEDTAFKEASSGVEACILTQVQADALNLIKD